ncbi:DNA mismatch repair protein MutS [Chlamydiota bacterium]
MTAITPMMRQYQEIKKGVRDAILFFRLGDFYEMFFDDAKEASSVLEIALTARDGGNGLKVPMCGVPYHSAEGYINKLLAVGKKVAICEQVEDPRKAKGIVKREVTRVITPGTVLSEGVLRDKKNNYITCIYENNNEFGFCFMDISTGEFSVTEFNSLDNIISELSRICPSECLLQEEQFTRSDDLLSIQKEFPSILVSTIEDWRFDYEGAYPVLTNHFKVKTLDGFGCQELTRGICSAGALLYYLKEELGHCIDHVRKITRYRTDHYMVIDPTTKRNLELVESLQSGAIKGTLLSVLDYTITAMGSRLLFSWMLHPLLDIREIVLRSDGIEELVGKNAVMVVLRDILKEVRDIERLMSRIYSGYTNARDLVSLRNSLAVLPKILTEIEPCNSVIIKQARENIANMDDLVELISTVIVDDPPITVKDGGMIKEGYNHELDELREITRSGKNWIRTLQKSESEKTGIKSLKVAYNKVFGYYIEVTKSNLDQVPEEYMRKQTLVNSERFITVELKEYESKVLGAQEKSNELEYVLFQEVKEKIKEYTIPIQNVATGIALLDTLASLAWIAQRNNYKRPTINHSDELTVTNGRHPVLEQTLDSGKFVPNDTILNTEDHQLLIITGPNMAGKSTYIRQVALLVIMAQMGSFIPADEAIIGIVDRVFTRVGASDDIMRGQSTFMVEMSETANIINNATNKSLIILDEIGRGTSTFDGISIAWSVAEYIHNTAELRARTLFATHFFELTDLELTLPGIKNYNIAVKEWNDEIIFLRKIMKGSTDKSYGIHVARLAGLPKEVIERAKDILNCLEESYINEDEMPKYEFKGQTKNTTPDAPFSQQLSLFDSQQEKLYKKIQKLDINTMTPLEALNELKEIKESLNS